MERDDFVKVLSESGRKVFAALEETVAANPDLSLKETENGYYLLLGRDSKAIRIVQIGGGAHQQLETRVQWITEHLDLTEKEARDISFRFSNASFEANRGNFDNWRLKFKRDFGQGELDRIKANLMAVIQIVREAPLANK